MRDQRMPSAIDEATLAEAFPIEYREPATLAGTDAARRLAPWQWTERFAVQVGFEQVLIPARLHFASEQAGLASDAEPWLFARALQTRSNDGFERQRAASDLLGSLQPWAAPFIVALIGEYVVEILDDIAAALTPERERIIGSFIAHNRPYWNRTRRRVTSYWNAYYRARWIAESRRAERREEYAGFRLVQQLDAAAARCTPPPHE